jgi:hypothetical protein
MKATERRFISIKEVDEFSVCICKCSPPDSPPFSLSRPLSIPKVCPGFSFENYSHTMYNGAVLLYLIFLTLLFPCSVIPINDDVHVSQTLQYSNRKYRPKG